MSALTVVDDVDVIVVEDGSQASMPETLTQTSHFFNVIFHLNAFHHSFFDLMV